MTLKKAKVRGDLGISYDADVLRLIDAFRGIGMYVGSVVLTRWRDQHSAVMFKNRLESLGVRVFRHFPIEGYPYDVEQIVSDRGFGRNEYVETTRPLVLVTAPGPGSGKMAVCLSQLYQEHQRGVKAGYAKFETFPIWNLPLNHPVNIAYEAATADLDDVNMIDPFHLEAYGETTVNYNRDIEIFPVLRAVFERIYGQSPYKSPTDMGVNMIKKLHHRRRSLPGGRPSGDHSPVLCRALRAGPGAHRAGGGGPAEDDRAKSGPGTRRIAP